MTNCTRGQLSADDEQIQDIDRSVVIEVGGDVVARLTGMCAEAAFHYRDVRAIHRAVSVYIAKHASGGQIRHDCGESDDVIERGAYPACVNSPDYGMAKGVHGWREADDGIYVVKAEERAGSHGSQ